MSIENFNPNPKAIAPEGPNLFLATMLPGPSRVGEYQVAQNTGPGAPVMNDGGQPVEPHPTTTQPVEPHQPPSIKNTTINNIHDTTIDRTNIRNTTIDKTNIRDTTIDKTVNKTVNHPVTNERITNVGGAKTSIMASAIGLPGLPSSICAEGFSIGVGVGPASVGGGESHPDKECLAILTSGELAMNAAQEARLNRDQMLAAGDRPNNPYAATVGREAHEAEFLQLYNQLYYNRFYALSTHEPAAQAEHDAAVLAQTAYKVWTHQQ
jgi:hypothetical protein